MTDVVLSMEQQVGSLWNLVEVLQERVISLEAERHDFFHATTVHTDGFHHCRAANCNKSFETQASLDDHMRSAKGPGHQALRALLNETDCQTCDPKTQASVSHETCLHSHSYGHPTDLPSQNANNESYSSKNVTAAFAPSNPFHSNGETPPSKPEAAAYPSNPARFAERAYAASNNYPTPDPTASIDIAEVTTLPITVSHGINPDIPNDDPPQYTEQTPTAHPPSPPHDNATLHSQTNHKLTFLSHFIKEVLQQHTGNTNDPIPFNRAAILAAEFPYREFEAGQQCNNSDSIPFDKEAFLAAEFPYREHEIEQQRLDDAEDSEDGEECYPIALMSEDDILAAKHRRIGILSAFADGIFEVARLGPEFFCLETVVVVWRGVGDGFRVEGMW